MMSKNWTIAVGSALLCIASEVSALDKGSFDQEMAMRATNDLKAARSLDVPNSDEITNLILQENFIEFENRSKAYELKFLKEPIYESPLLKLYDVIDSKNDKVLVKLDKWVDSRPSYISYGARGVYKKNRGFWNRGSNFIQKTPTENISKMMKMHEEGKADLLVALKKNSKFVPAYSGLIGIERASGDISTATKILETAVREIPQTYYIRYGYLQSLRPRWGGSYEKMQSFADNLDKEALINPRIWSLKAEVFAEQGYNAWIEKDYKSAIRHYTAALSYGDRMDFLKNRGYIYMTLKKYDLALADLTRYREYDQNNQEVNDRISRLSSSRTDIQ
jgi:tetratricopeptide (TPR) repeat protein